MPALSCSPATILQLCAERATSLPRQTMTFLAAQSRTTAAAQIQAQVLGNLSAPGSFCSPSPQSQPLLSSLLWGFRVTAFIFEAPHGQALGQMSKPVTNSIGGHCFVHGAELSCALAVHSQGGRW